MAMKYLILAAVCWTMVLSSAEARRNDLFGHNGLGMFGGELADGWAKEQGRNRWAWRCGTATALGLGKELYDSTGRGHVDPKDLAATMALSCLLPKLEWKFSIR